MQNDWDGTGGVPCLTSVSTHCLTSMGAAVMSSTLYWMLVMDLSVLLIRPMMVI